MAIARALVNDPAVLLADEPTGAVDTATGEEIGRLLLDLNAAGQTLVLVTHSPDLAARYARRTVRLLDGRVASDTGDHAPSEPASRRGSAAMTGGAVLDGGQRRGGPPPGADHGDLRGAGRGRSGRNARPDPGHQRQRAVPAALTADHGADLAVTIDAAKVTPAELARTAHLPGVTQAAGPVRRDRRHHHRQHATGCSQSPGGAGPAPQPVAAPADRRAGR